MQHASSLPSFQWAPSIILRAVSVASQSIAPDSCLRDMQDYFLLSEMEAQERQHKEPEMGWQTSARLTSLASHQFSRPGSERRSTMDSQVSESLLSSEYPQACPSCWKCNPSMIQHGCTG